jgi:glycine/D-amino acid oxidase-like deaminating enzyme
MEAATSIELKALLARIDRDLAENRKFAAEQQKLGAEQQKLGAEALKFSAEALKLERDRWLAPALAAGGLAVGALASAATIASVFFRH